MAQKVTVTIFDDIDGALADETVEFALDGVDYTIDLSAANSTRMREALQDFVNAARRVDKFGRPQRKRRKTGATTEPGEQSKARKWAQENGIQVASIGRLSEEVIDQYRAATR